MMSPEKERELTSKILERAQLAQMTRQLKLGLSKVPTKKKSNDKSNSIVLPATSDDEDEEKEREMKSRKRTSDAATIKDAITRISPLKKPLLKDSGELNVSPLKDYHRPSTPPRVPPSSSSSAINENFNNEKNSKLEPPSTPKAAVTAPVLLTGNTNRLLVTPKANVVNITGKTPGGQSNNNNDNDVAADLLMYLATSPYVSSKGNYDKVLSTPSMSINMSSSHGPYDREADGAIRFSHMKPSISSPQSTFKTAPLDYTAGGTVPFTDVLMDSPTIFMTKSPPQRKKNNGQNNNLNTDTIHSSNVPSTPSRELRSSVGSVAFLKTPNFNMFDYVHTLFSPSPRVNMSAGNAVSPGPPESSGSNLSFSGKDDIHHIEDVSESSEKDILTSEETAK
ncbi:hypothetical protein Kpol_1020p32 [Vanderwaltozyma polyspora DSM 70294]|uniref:Uncharacterized protein n=1 Tax=Vanderwaltozyma polyspora (strain ATCC 22028 / DSM 70294 / BCRC 21397 / CBS 2163 / NBRC 10782 / NRRL Y-8283 / UCD 57-17) TaxID=436907 RepID=A7TLE2_VANPO|nr:uncharacterized protein Kpol_1020p32 [Vanderwaltozyma polyspora DSM 70294]EDO16923.1 hypothetical protein Kpol_1020p32 [Vanderwaltozyma polyspora DSM 70294]